MGYTFTERIGQRASFDIKGNAEYTRRFLIQFDDAVNDPNTVLSVPELPRPFDFHPTDIFAQVSTVRPEQLPGNTNIWEAEVVYSRVVRDEEQARTNPLDRARYCEWDTHEYEVASIYDVYGNQIVNSAGDPFSPTAKREDSRVVVTMTYNDIFVPTWILDVRNVINSAAFSIEGYQIDVGCAKIRRVHVSKWQVENRVRFRTVQVVCEIREKQLVSNISYGGNGSSATTAASYYAQGFQQIIQDAGYYEISSGNHQKIFEQGLELSQPALLNGQGAQLTRPVTMGQEYYRGFDVYKPFNFGLIGFPP
jgi:hypothetical protein